jgi:hypothetical protein
VRASLVIAALTLSACGSDPKADFAILVKSFKQIPKATLDAKAAQGFGTTLAINDLGDAPFPLVPTSVTGGVDLALLRSGTRGETVTDMDLDGKPGTGTANEKVDFFSIAAGDFLAYVHPYKANRVVRCLAWQTTARDAYLLAKNPYDAYVTACIGTSGNDVPTTCQLCGPTNCGTTCTPDTPEDCTLPSRDPDGGTP